MKKYIGLKTTNLYESLTGNKRSQVLIYGEEVEVINQNTGDRTEVVYRQKYPGFVKPESLMNSRQLEIYFIDVGQGDSTFIITPKNKKILVDGGANSQALGFIAWKYQLADNNVPDLEIDLLVLTHADGDHLGGLLPLINHGRIKIKKIISNGIALFQNKTHKCGNLDPTKKFLVDYHSSLDQLDDTELNDDFKKWKKAIKDNNISYQSVDSTCGVISIGDPSIEFEILGPKLETLNGQRVFSWFDNHAHTINGHSVVVGLKYKDVNLLLSGDLNLEGGEYLCDDPVIASKFSAHIFKTPHHGSHDFYYPFLNEVRPQISVISSGDSPDHGHPRAIFLGSVGLASRSKQPLVFATEIAATFNDASEKDIAKFLNQADIDASELKRGKLFKKSLNGMINVRTDGKKIYAARRVQSGYQWESYGPLDPEAKPGVFV